MGQKKKILVVDDLEINQTMLSDLLSSRYELISAYNGLEALQIVEEQYYDIAAILLDIVMPVMDGFEVLKQLKKKKKWSKIPVVVMTQNGDDQYELKALSLGASDFVSRPYIEEIVLHRVENLIKLRETSIYSDLVSRDYLTGIANKEAFYHEVSTVLENDRDQEYDMLSLDFERFKLVNESYGVEEGNNLLKYTAILLKNMAREHHGKCGRITADIFVLLYPRREGYPQILVQEIQTAVQEYPLDMKLSIKIGIYEITNRQIPVIMMTDRAKLAASSIKGSYDKVYTYYDDSIRENLLSEQRIINDMKTAVEKEQFQVYYQPKYGIHGEGIVGAEALVRWQHPEKGMMSPGVFIPIFEANGFITELDYFVWEKACRMIAERKKQHKKLIPVSVNVSRKDIYKENLPLYLKNLVERYGIEPEYLHLEITESAYTENPEQLIVVIQQLRGMGFVIEMDDFGSAYSSLNMLSELPINILKLDMKFLHNSGDGDKKKSVISFIISLAKWMRLGVVAEGVETREQVDMLESMECDYIQGFYFARPMPYEEFDMLMEGEMDKDRSVKLHEPVILRNSDAPESEMVIADDIAINRKILSGLFEKEFTIVEVSDGRMAWDYIQKNYQKIRIILLDLSMPDMDGYQLLELIMQSEKYSRIPVVITSQVGEHTQTEVLKAGVADFINKPYRPDITRKRIDNVLKASSAGR